MKIKTALEHSNEVSGTWIMTDGTKCHWGEGRSSAVICVIPDGNTLHVPVSKMEKIKAKNPEYGDLIDAIIDATENGPDSEESRQMTEAEEAEHEMAST